MTDHRYPFDPDWTLAPGDLLRDELKARGITFTRLAQMTGRPRSAISKLINAYQPFTPEFALQLEAVFAISAEFWVTAEARYRLDLARGRKRIGVAGR